MRSSYEPYPIFDLKSGLRTEKEAWLLPQDAFSTFFDWYLYQGVLQKRHGYTEFAQFVKQTLAACGEGVCGEGKFGEGRVITYPGNAIMGIFNFYFGTASQALFWDTKRLNKYNTVTKVCEDLTVLKIQFKTGAKEILVGDTITGATSGDTAVVDAVVHDDGTWAGGDAHGTLIISGTDENSFEEGGEILTVSGTTMATAKGQPSYELLTGDDENFIWFENWRDIAYITNNVDQIRKYDGSYQTRMTIDLDVEGGPDNDVNTCLLIFHVKNRILLLRTGERGESHYQRARWSNVTSRGEAIIFSDVDYSDADRDDWIMGADFIGNELIVFFERGAMKFVYTGDPEVPFKWENIPSQEGCYATMSISPFSDELMTIGPTRIVATDGREVYGADEKIPDLMLEWNQDALQYCYSMVIEEMRQTLTSYPSAGVAKPDQVLVLNYEEDSYAIFRLPVHVMGYSSLESTVAPDDMTGISLDDLDYSLDDKELQAGYPTSLMGCRDGWIYKMNDGGADNGVAIECEAISARWNPYQKEQKRAILGWIDFLVDSNDNASFDVKFFLDTENSSYKTETIECTETGTLRDKVIKRVHSGAEGDFHRISLGNNASANRPRIHSIVPFFRRGGPLL
jgi:hypothetical protein